MQKTEDTVLFGKYRIIGTLGSGRNGSVLLAVHLGLHEYRAIKKVAGEKKESLESQNTDKISGQKAFPREADILKSLRHPGIPIIYDLETDPSGNYYIIEEYLEGHSLSALIKERGSLTRAEILTYGCELCRILVYLHSLKPNPILHLDLQPKNLMICCCALKLIDFDQAVFAAGEENLDKRFGTPGFAAPELYEKRIPDERADIYAIGALLFFMGTGKSPEESETEHVWERFGSRLGTVIGKCLNPQREKRFQSVRELEEELLALRTGVFNESQIPLLTISVAGSCPGVGATHTALALSAFLTTYAGPCLYEEKNMSKAGASLGKYLGIQPDRKGIFRAGLVHVKPALGESVHPDENEFKIRVEDLGAVNTKAEVSCMIKPGTALFLLVCGGREWELLESQRAIRMIEKEARQIGVQVKILAAGRRKAGRIILPWEAKRLEAEPLPWIEEPYETLEKEAEKAFFHLLSDTKVEKWLLSEKKKVYVRLCSHLGKIGKALKQRLMEKGDDRKL